ncbi:hypothetical protein AciX9_4523 (plasmid) [Granulicella tundricola MP5ACTX9]|uniref:Uncharacterized protein n=1 Tax=Granulicella tundricola (strain ATCC BAA-1859 / DSM 23138 / MP5ACTX9) TaxID=1198114 RepID=E8X7N0_GRATM|nr:hypothetical protein AciX9_4523 [Granulicella tundricola MP5ACTX9]
MSWFTDNCGTTFTPSNGSAPTAPMTVTTNTNGVLGTGTWTGSVVVKH